MRGLMLAIGIVVITIALPEVPAQDKQPATKKGVLDEVTGTWRLVQFEEGGKDALTDEVKGRTVTFDHNKWAVQRKGKVLWQGTVKVVDAKSDPIKVEQHTESGTGKGQTRKVIWRFKDDELHVAGAYEDRDFPTDFKTGDGTKWTYSVFKRVKDKK